MSDDNNQDDMVYGLVDELIPTGSDVYKMTQQLGRKLDPIVSESVDKVVAEIGLDQRGMLFANLLVQAWHPDPLSGFSVARRFPYASVRRWDEMLTSYADLGFATKSIEGDFASTDSGRNANDIVTDSWYAGLRLVEEKLDGAIDLARMIEIGDLVLAACMSAPEPVGSWALRHSLSRAERHRTDTPLIGRLDQQASDLNAFRDDAHIAAFSAHSVHGHEWELFTMLWNGTVTDIVEMADKFAFRGHDQMAYQIVADSLEARGWIRPSSGGSLVMTSKGTDVRAHAELMTDRYFFGPWLSISPEEREELRSLWTALFKALDGINTD